MSRFLEAIDYGWPSLRAATGAAELVFVPMVGGRLMGIRLDGHELLWVNPDTAGMVPDLEHLPARFPLWGGEKTWVAPQSAWHDGAPSPDLDSGPYDATAQDARLVLKSATCRQTGLEITRQIEVGDSGNWATRHSIVNRGTQPVEVGPWTVMMINRDARFVLPALGPTIYMHQRPGREAPVGSLLTIDCFDATRFKTGHQLAEAWFGAFLPLPDGRTALLVQSCSPDPGDGRWAHGHPAEIYNADLYPYCEMELHGPAHDLNPGESTSWTVCTRVSAVTSMPETEDDYRICVADRGLGGHVLA